MMHKDQNETDEDYDNFFQLFDKDGGGSVRVEEMSMVFGSIGTLVSEGFIAGTVFECFKKLMTELNRDEFKQWLNYLHEKYSHKTHEAEIAEMEDEGMREKAAKTVQKYVRASISNVQNTAKEVKAKVRHSIISPEKAPLLPGAVSQDKPVEISQDKPVEISQDTPGETSQDKPKLTDEKLPPIVSRQASTS
jgi:hypothetical protein